MNIGGYRADGNIMTVPELKELLLGDVDLPDLKDKVDNIQENVTTLNEAIGELETGLAETISDLNDTIADVSDNATNIADLQAIVQRLLSEKIGYYVVGDEINYNSIPCSGFITGNSRVVEFFVPDCKINPNLIYTLNDVSIAFRQAAGGTGWVNNNGTPVQLGTNLVPLMVDNEIVVSDVGSIDVLEASQYGLTIRINFNAQIYTSVENPTQIVGNNRPISVVFYSNIIVS